MIRLEPHAEGVILPVRAQPGARRSAITGEMDGALKVAAISIPEKGKANATLIEVLCEELALRQSEVELLAGGKSRSKRFLVRGLTLEELAIRLEKALRKPP